MRKWKLPEVGPGERVIELISGGLRAITGAIGNREEDDYRTITPDATMGVRGTDYALRLCPEGECRIDGEDGAVPAGLYVGVAEGRIELLNGGGEAAYGAEEYGYVAAADVAPERADPGVAGLVYTDEELAARASDEEEEGTSWWWAIGGLLLFAL